MYSISGFCCQYTCVWQFMYPLDETKLLLWNSDVLSSVSSEAINEQGKLVSWEVFIVTLVISPLHHSGILLTSVGYVWRLPVVSNFLHNSYTEETLWRGSSSSTSVEMTSDMFYMNLFASIYEQHALFGYIKPYVTFESQLPSYWTNANETSWMSPLCRMGSMLFWIVAGMCY